MNDDFGGVVGIVLWSLAHPNSFNAADMDVIADLPKRNFLVLRNFFVDLLRRHVVTLRNDYAVVKRKMRKYGK